MKISLAHKMKERADKGKQTKKEVAEQMAGYLVENFLKEIEKEADSGNYHAAFDWTQYAALNEYAVATKVVEKLRAEGFECTYNGLSAILSVSWHK